ncbi:MAG TPA: type II secretion system F family protein [Stellaceae bacterium]|nr:type II secretion system F family protein [Stellaceae bacterium]
MSSMPVGSTRFEDFLPFGLGLNDVVALTAGLAVVTTFFAVWQALRANTSFERRLTQIVDKKEAMRQAALASRRQRQRMTPAGMMREMVTRLNLLRSQHATEARMLLARAGIRSRDAMIRYLFARVSLPLVFAFAALADSYTLHLVPVPPNFRFLAAGACAVFGFFAPGIYIKNLTAKRSKRIQLGLPDALDLMIICAEAGLSLDATLGRVARELEANCPDLAEELAITAAELTFLPDRRQAFENLNNRTDMSSIRGVVNTLTQTAKFGTPLAHSLRVLAVEYRDARMFRAEEKAARLPALMTVPMILFILPTLFIVLMGPAALGIVDTFNHSRGGGTRQVTAVTHSDSGDNGANPADTNVTEKSRDQPAPAAAAPAPAVPKATLSLAQKTVAVGEPIVVTVDARALAGDFDLQVVVVPANTPEKIADPKTFFAEAKPVSPRQMQVSVTARSAGRNEVRLYFVPHFGTSHVIAARAEISVTAAAK